MKSPKDVSAEELISLAMERAASQRRFPASTYRLQFHKGFTFADAAAIAPYLAELGITHVYASPYLRAVAGSTHGYDVINPNCLNPELGSTQDYEAFLDALKLSGLSHILDTVPNHSGVDTNDNLWWNDVLAYGRQSPYAEYFDIAWGESRCTTLRDRVLLPILGAAYNTVLESGEIKLTFDAAGGHFQLHYFDRRFPVNPRTYAFILSGLPPGVRVPAGWEALVTALSDDGDRRQNASRLAAAVQTTPDVGPAIEKALAAINGSSGEPRSFDRLDSLLNQQHYRLAYWRIASEQVNYRRFFEINGLAALKMERADVFAAAHALTLRLVAEGKVSGLRVDHPDGLYDPQQYLLRLQRQYILACAKEIAGPETDWETLRPQLLQKLEAIDLGTASSLPLYVVVEKILAADEVLPADWACHGTSGYDFLNMVNGLFVDLSGEEPLTAAYHDFVGSKEGFEEIAYRAKREVLDISFTSDLQRLVDRLERLVCGDRRARDFSAAQLHAALTEIIACFPVYRSYISSPAVSETDARQIGIAMTAAALRSPELPAEVFDFIGDMILQRSPASFSEAQRAEQLLFAGRFQQLTSPATAKGVEDTAFYRYHRLISLNEVGGDPGQFGIAPERLHRYLQDRHRLYPHALGALSTHDTKRAEDVRARLNILSEVPEAWCDRANRWRSMNALHTTQVGARTAPAPHEQYLLYQTLVGAWPLSPGSAEEHQVFISRIQNYMQKALREAKQNTSWNDPNAAWEAAVERFISRVLDRAIGRAFIADIEEFSATVSRGGLINSLSQTLLRLTAPGVPDTYQGSDMWDFSLVDPDNRRPVDYAARRALMGQIAKTPPAELLASITDGRAKLWLTHLALLCRRERPSLFTTGAYTPLSAEGPRAQSVFAFGRGDGDHQAIVVVPRLTARWLPDGSPPLGAVAWEQTRLIIPPQYRGLFQSALTGEPCDLTSTALMSDVLATFPVALLVRQN